MMQHNVLHADYLLAILLAGPKRSTPQVDDQLQIFSSVNVDPYWHWACYCRDGDSDFAMSLALVVTLALTIDVTLVRCCEQGRSCF
jgi:hypothetical protein